MSQKVIYSCRLVFLLCGLIATARVVPCFAITMGGFPSKPEIPAKSQYRIGVSALKNDDLEGAEAAFKESLKLDPKLAESLIGLAEVAIRKDQAKAARVLLQKALDLAPRNANVQRVWGHYLVLEKDFEQAEAAFKKAIEFDPRGIAQRLDLGDLYLSVLKKPREAILIYRAMLKIAPDHASAHYALGSALAATGKIEQAVFELNEAGRLAPRNPLSFQTLGILYLARKDYTKALEAFALAIEAQPKFYQAHVARGDIYLATGKDDKAIIEYSTATKIVPNLSTVRMKIGIVHERNKRLAEAKQAYLTAIDLNPKEAIAYNNLAWIAIERKTSLDEAVTWAKKAVELAPDVPQFQDTLGWVYRARGELDKAIALLKKVAVIKPRKPEIIYHLGVVYAENGETREAVATLNKALSLKGDFKGAEDARHRLKKLGSSGN